MNHFIDNLAPLFAIVFTFGIPGIIIFWSIHNKHKERMRLLKKDLLRKKLKNILKDLIPGRGRTHTAHLEWGILLTMIGIGIFLGILLKEAGYTESLVPVMILVFAGLGF